MPNITKPLTHSQPIQVPCKMTKDKLYYLNQIRNTNRDPLSPNTGNTAPIQEPQTQFSLSLTSDNPLTAASPNPPCLPGTSKPHSSTTTGISITPNLSIHTSHPSITPTPKDQTLTNFTQTPPHSSKQTKPSPKRLREEEKGQPSPKSQKHDKIQSPSQSPTTSDPDTYFIFPMDD